MISHTATIRVGYAETDKMGFVHHSNYVRYYETARWELFRSVGLTYKSIEEQGIWMPVIDVHAVYKKPAFYDDILRIETHIKDLPKVKFHCHFSLFNQHNEEINHAVVTLAFMHEHNKKPCAVPDFILNTLSPYFVRKEVAL